MCFLGYNNSFALMCSIYSTQHTQSVGLDSSSGLLGWAPSWSCLKWVPDGTHLVVSPLSWFPYSPCKQAGNPSKVTRCTSTWHCLCLDLNCPPAPWGGTSVPQFANGETEARQSLLSRVTQEVLEPIVHMQMAFHHHPHWLLLTMFSKENIILNMMNWVIFN